MNCRTNRWTTRRRTSDPLQLIHFPRRQLAMVADLQPAVADRPDAHPLEPDDRVPDGVAHVAHLPGLALVNRNRHQGLVSPRPEPALQQAHHRRRGAFALDAHAAAHPVQAVLGRLAAHARVVLPLDLVFRMEQLLGERAVIGQEQQSFGVVVEAAHRVDVLADVGQQVEHGRPPLGVLARRHVAPRLVEQDVAMTRGDADARTVDADVVASRFCARSEFQHGGAVHRDAALRDERFGGPTRGDACGREDLLKPFAGVVVGHRVLVSRL
jgi:hypothetical protein